MMREPENLRELIEIGKNSGKTEVEKQRDMEPFYNGDPEIGRLKSHARTVCNAFNRTNEDEMDKRLAILKSLFGDCPDNAFIKPPFYCDFGYNIHAGDNFFANYDCVILDAAPVVIGKNCLMGPQTCIYTVSHPMDPELRTANYVFGKQVTIGDNVWFGGNCAVLPGVTIGNNVICGAGSVITHDVPDNAVVAGNPAKIIRMNEPDHVE